MSRVSRVLERSKSADAHRMIRAFAAALLLLGVASCASGYEIAAAPGFVRLERADVDLYDWRAVAPDGVVVALRVIALHHAADLGLWAYAVTLHMRETEGYALLARKDVRSLDRTPGVELVFGHDESGKPFTYRVRLFVTAGRLYLVEAGGPKEQMDRYGPSIDWMLGRVRVG